MKFEKYNLMNVHEQGTIEWRGLRLGSERDGNNFKRDQKHIMDYLKFVYKFAVELARTVDRLMDYELGGVTLREVQREYAQTTRSRKGLSSIIIEQFRGLFEVHFGLPKTVVKNAITALARNIQIKSTSSQHPLDPELVSDSMTNFALLTAPIFKQGEYYGTILDPNIISGAKPKFQMELKQANFSGAKFDFRGIKDWQRLMQNHGFVFLDCVFEDCQFYSSNPSDYGNFPGSYGFDDCSFIDCQWAFPGGPGFKSNPTWNEFMANEGIDRMIYNSVRNEPAVPTDTQDAEEFEQQADHVTEGAPWFANQSVIVEDDDMHSPEYVVKNFGEVLRYRIENGKFVKDPNGDFIHLFRRGNEPRGFVMSKDGANIMDMKNGYGKWYTPPKAYQNVLAQWIKIRTKTHAITDYELSEENKYTIEKEPNLKIGTIKRYEF